MESDEGMYSWTKGYVSKQDIEKSLFLNNPHSLLYVQHPFRASATLDQRPVVTAVRQVQQDISLLILFLNTHACVINTP